MKICLLFSCFLLLALLAKAQSEADSASLREVVVKAYFSDQPLLKVPSSVSVVNSSVLEQHAPASFVSAVNTVPGVRMEERSPGSYRLSIRGSLLRSPFGIRNVKVYLDDFMLTDASGNTYLNILDAGSASRMEIIKGPEGSIYGANSGGVVLVRSSDPPKEGGFRGAGTISAGSYGLFHEQLSLQSKVNKFSFSINQAYQKSDGYRINSALDRKYIHFKPQWNYSPGGTLKALAVLSDLEYQTPGGLNLAQFTTKPKAARPNAAEQQAAVYNKTFLGGLSNELKLGRNLRHVLALTGSLTDFRNSAIANYELRDESSLGARTYLEVRDSSFSFPLNLQLGLEAQSTWADVSTFINNGGTRADLLQTDDLKAKQGFGFIHFSADPVKNLTIESALSLNLYRYSYSSPQLIANRRFKKELMPRFAVSYRPGNNLSLRASLSRGYSPPTLEEVKPSGQAINTSIQAEKGWNHELGFRVSLLNSRFYWDAVYFYYLLKDAIVKRAAADETEFYINAGSTNQQGLESELVIRFIDGPEASFLKAFDFRGSFTYSHFRFGKYLSSAGDFSGNKLTGVPTNVIVSSISARIKPGFTCFIEHNYTSSLPLNDANSEYAGEYHLVNAKIAWNAPLKRKLQLFVGADNLLNRKYSLGNDLNAFGNRYYNAAAPRNYYFGISVRY